MKISLISKITVAVTVVLLCAACAHEDKKKFVAPNDKMICYEGRVSISPDSARYDYPGSSIKLAFYGTSVAAKLKANAGYYWVELDDDLPYKLNTHLAQEADSSVFVFADSLAEGKHCISLTLISEGLFVCPAFYGFILNSDAGVMPIDSKNELNIEFIGNSITCGYGVEADSATCHFNDSTSNFCKTYAAITARNLNANKMVVARSGIGAYRNYADNVDGSEWPMPRVYFNQTITNRDSLWNFDRFTPNIVCVNLGTNDLSVEGYKPELFEKAYFDFIKGLREKYADAKIVMLTGTMLTGDAAQLQKDILNRICLQMNNAGDTSVYRFDIEPQDGITMGYGADYHPSEATQKRMANELTTFIKGIL